ncbi:MAG: hypothetical protein H7Z41_17880 [Cytophagales bacterium]|nr:hypothetical protein [Armatimonadota bacterium]
MIPVAMKSEKSLTFDLHPLYASILLDGQAVREGEVLGLDMDLRRVMIAPYSGVIRLLVTGDGSERRVKVFLNEQAPSRREPLYAASSLGIAERN